MSDIPPPNTANAGVDPGWRQVATEMHAYHPLLQEHATRNLEKRGFEISPEHHQEHVDIARPVVLNIDDLPEGEQNLLGEMMEIGQEALGVEIQTVPPEGALMGVITLPNGQLDFSRAAVFLELPKSNRPQATGPMTGVVTLPGGELDYSRAAVVTLPKSDESLRGHVEPPNETADLQTILQEAEKVGIDERRLKQLSQTLRMLDKPLGQNLALMRIVKKEGIDMTPKELYRLTRYYQRDVIRSSENGTLFHYHQTELKNLESILDNGGLLSTDEQSRRGNTRTAAGSRPDVVQMTRDAYDKDGNLEAAGIKASSAGLGAAGEIGFVIDESIMDDPEYDCIVHFPNAKTIPVDKMTAILVSDETNIPYVQGLLLKKGVAIKVIPRTTWLQRYTKT